MTSQATRRKKSSKKRPNKLTSPTPQNPMTPRKFPVSALRRVNREWREKNI